MDSILKQCLTLQKSAKFSFKESAVLHFLLSTRDILFQPPPRIWYYQLHVWFV